jgi:hypothetical protein
MPDNDLTPQAAILTAAFSSSPPATPAPSSPTIPTSSPTAAPTAPATPVEPYAPVRLSPSHTAQWIAWEKDNLAQGKITPEEAARRFEALGATPEQLAPDTRSAEMRMLDEHFHAAKPEEFLILYGAPGQVAPPMTPELKQFDTSARTWLSGAEVTRNGGNALVDMISKVAQQTKAMSPDQLESYGLLQYERLERIYGAELETKLSAAGHMVVELDKKTPGLKNLLRSRGLGDNAEIASMLIQQAERYWIRRKGR